MTTTDPQSAISIHWLDDATVILRQSKALDYEAPILALLLGEESALLLDTGATSDATVFPLRAVVDSLIDGWLDARERPGLDPSNRRYRLVVAHTHAHGDHIAADAQFADRADTAVVGADLDDVCAFFGFEGWPHGQATLDLGGRVIEVIPAPGHERSAVVFYDAATGTLFTGDTIYPGRLYVIDSAAFRETIDRLAEFSRNHSIERLIGGHIEMTSTPGLDYPIGTVEQPDEAPLELPVSVISEVRDAAAEAGDRPAIVVRDRFILYNLAVPLEYNQAVPLEPA